jgi:DNA-binding transcriptional MocR family regulator
MSPGYLQLRKQIARIGLSCGLDLSPDEIIITNGCHEAVFLALMVLCKPGDSVVFESPMYFNLLQLLEQLDLRVIELPSSQIEGVNLDTLGFVIEKIPC